MRRIRAAAPHPSQCLIFLRLVTSFCTLAGEISLQRGIVLQVVVAFELLDPRARIPLLAIALVAADVEVGIREKPRSSRQRIGQ